METLPIERRRLLRDHRLRWQVRRCWDGSPFYRARLEAAGLDPSTFGGLADLHRIPILRADDLPPPDEAGDASGAWSVASEEWWVYQYQPEEGWIRVLTDGDYLHQADLAARALWASGGRSGGRLTWARPSWDRETSAVIARAGQRIGMKDRHDSAVAWPPKNGLLVVAVLSPDQSDGIGGDLDPGDTAVSWGASWPPLGTADDRPAGALTVDRVAPTLAYACREDEGVHWADDHFLIEVVHSDDERAVETGSVGAVVITELSREGSPLIRFWTGLEAALIEEPCPCGRTSTRSPSVRPLP